MQHERRRVFLSYSRKDQRYRTEFLTHFKPLEQFLSIWHDGHIEAGEDWKQIVDESLSGADLVACLLSPDFLASPFCLDVELAKAHKRWEAKQALIVPILIRECAWKLTSLGKLHVLSAEKPIGSYPQKARRDAQWQVVMEHVRTLALKAPKESVVGPKPQSGSRSRNRAAPQSFGAAAIPLETTSAAGGGFRSIDAHFPIPVEPPKMVSSIKDALTIVPGREANAVQLVRERSISAPSREVAVVPLTDISVTDPAASAKDSQVPLIRTGFAFPDFPLHDSMQRQNAARVTWELRGAGGREQRFGIGRDGSFAAAEFIMESLSLAHRHGVPCIDLFACTQFVMGALLFARALATRQEGFKRAWIVLALGLIGREHLVYGAENAKENPKADQFTTSERHVRLGAHFDARMSDDELRELTVTIGASLSARFGCDHRPKPPPQIVRPVFSRGVILWGGHEGVHL